MGPAFTRVAPFAVFIAFIAVPPLVAGLLDPRWWAAVRGLAAGV
jgi:hypothetical protein